MNTKKNDIAKKQATLRSELVEKIRQQSGQPTKHETLRNELIANLRAEIELRGKHEPTPISPPANAREAIEFVNQHCLSEFTESAVVVGVCRYTLNFTAHSGIVIKDNEDVSILTIEPSPVISAYHNHHVIDSVLDEYNLHAEWVQKFTVPAPLNHTNPST